MSDALAVFLLMLIVGSVWALLWYIGREQMRLLKRFLWNIFRFMGWTSYRPPEAVRERDRLRVQNNERAGILLHLASVLGDAPIRVERDMPDAVAAIIAERDRLRAVVAEYQRTDRALNDKPGYRRF